MARPPQYVRLTVQTTVDDVVQILDTLKACGFIKGGVALHSTEPLPPALARALAAAAVSPDFQEIEADGR
jgi:hypothetical protein